MACSLRSRTSRMLLAAALALSFSAAPSAERVDEYALKAAFLFHFTAFVEWPDSAFASPDAEFRICLVGGNPFGEAIFALQSRRYRERAIAIVLPQSAEQARQCQIIYFHDGIDADYRPLAFGQAALPLLSVSSAEDFAAAGGAIGFLLEAGRVRMEVNVAATQAADLRVSAKLLEVASRIVGAPHQANQP